MFDRIVDRQLARRAARRGAFACVAAVVEIAFGAALAVATVHLARRTEPAPLVEVTFVRVAAARPAPPPPPPPPLASGGVAARRPPLTPRPSPLVPARPLALHQPRVVPAVADLPAAGGGGAADDDAGGVEGGVVGGVPGGVVGGVVGGVLGAERWADGQQDTARRERPQAVTDAPQYFAAGFRRPAELAPGCVRGAIRLPPDLDGTITTQLTVKFAVGRDGRVGATEFLTPVLDPRVRDAVLRALASCRWSPALDATGAPVALWVVLPIRFVSE